MKEKNQYNIGKYVVGFAIGVLLSACFLTSAEALPALQLGEGSTGGWSYAASDTWVSSTMDPFKLNAYANGDGVGSTGAYAWDAEGAGAQTAYLVAAAVPQLNVADAFDITVMNGGLLSVFDSGFGTPPIEDSNSIPGHGIFATYFEIYQFNFDGPFTSITNTEPGEGSDVSMGFIEVFDITINSLADGVAGVHFDLFTVKGDGILELGTPNKFAVNDFAPPSHDAEVIPDRDFETGLSEVPEPTTVLLLGIGLVGLAGAEARRRRKKKVVDKS